MSSSDCFEVYKDEIELITSQNGFIECELYSIVAGIIRGLKKSNNISLRDVSVRRNSIRHKEKFMSQKGFPDFMILERGKKDDAEIFGAIEIKNVGVALNVDLDDKSKLTEQLSAHVCKFKKVILTNGLKWQFYVLGKSENEKNLEWTVELGELNRRELSFTWKNGDSWENLLCELDKIEWSKKD